MLESMGIEVKLKIVKIKILITLKLNIFSYMILIKIIFNTIELASDLESRLKVESLSMCKFNFIYSNSLNSVFNSNNFNNVDDVCVYS